MLSQEPGRIAVTGATGFIGSHLAQYFASQGHAVVSLSRRPPGRSLDARIAYVAWDLSRPVPERALRECQALVPCAHARYSPHNRSADELNVEGSSRLFQAARENGVGQIVYLSSLSAQPHVRSRYAKSKLAVEGLLDRERDTILRLGLVLGPGGFAKRIQRALVRTRVVPLLDGGRQPVWTIHIEDLCAIVVALLQSRGTGILQIGNPQQLSVAQVNRSLARALRRKVHFFPLPFQILYPLVKLAEQLGMDLPVTTENLLGLRGARQLSLQSDMEKIGCEVRSFEELLENGAIEEWFPHPVPRDLRWMALLRPTEPEMLDYARRETDWREADRFQPLHGGPLIGLAVLLGVGLMGLAVAPVRGALRLFKGEA